MPSDSLNVLGASNEAIFHCVLLFGRGDVEVGGMRKGKGDKCVSPTPRDVSWNFKQIYIIC